MPLSLRNLYPKLLGAISFLLGFKILFTLFVQGLSMQNISRWSHGVFGDTYWAEGLAMIVSFAIAALAITLGYKGVVYNNICIGRKCTID